MTGQQKQLLYIILGLIIVGLLLFFGYRYFFLPKVTPTDTSLLPGTGGNTGLLPTTVTPNQNQNSAEGTTLPDPTLFQIHDKPTVGFVVFTRGTNSYVRFIEQGSGHVYEYNFDAKQKIRISNTSIPKIQTASFAKNGNSVAFQYLENGVTRSGIGQLATTSEEGSYKKITFMPAGLTSIALSPSGEEVAYTTSGEDGGIVGIAGRDGTKARTVFTSPLVRWFVSWPSPDALLVESPLSSMGGSAFSVQARTSSVTPIVSTQGYFSGVVGAQSGIHFLYSPVWSKGVTRLNNKDDTEFVSFSMNTIPSKCSFMATSTDFVLCGSGSGSNTPIIENMEAWLRGEGYVKDVLYLVNYKKASWSPVVRDEDLGDRSFDIEHVEADARLLFGAFKEHEGETLWGFRIRPELLL